MSLHRYDLGQAVHLSSSFGRAIDPATIFRVTRQLPPLGNDPQYRVRSEDERHERVATEDSLAAAKGFFRDDAALVFAGS